MPLLTILWGFVAKCVLPWIWHAIRRFGSWFFIAALVIIIGMKFFGWKNNIYQTGYKVGYSQALTDHPTYVVNSGGVVTNVTNGDYKLVGVKVKILWLKLQFGY